MGDGRLAQILGHRNCEHIELERLTEADVTEYTGLWLGHHESEVSRTVFAKSEGNPFFMVELLRPFLGSPPPRADELALSGPALDIVQQRVRTLSKQTVALLAAAAVIGRDFDLGLLGYVTGHDPESILDLLEGARETNTILASSDRLGYFAFGHDLIRSVLLDVLSANEAARLHVRVAEALERRHPVGDGLPRPEIVHHLLSALPLGNITKAIDYAKRSARAAARLCAHADAAVLLRQALSGLDLAGQAHPRLRCDLLLGLALCERLSADSRFSEHLSEAVAIALEHGFGEVLADASRHMSFAPGFITLKGVREVLEAADRALPPDSKALRAEVLARLAWTPPYCFDAERAASLVAAAEQLAVDSRSSVALEAALSAKLYFSSGPDSEDLSQSIFNRIDLLCAERQHLNRGAWPTQAHFSRIVISLQRADMESVERFTAAFGSAAREFKQPEMEWHHQRACVVHRMNRGEFNGIKAALHDLQDKAEQAQLSGWRTVCATDWCVLLRETADVAHLARYAGAILPEEDACPYRRARRIRFLVEIGATERAMTALQELPAENLHKLPHDRDYLATLAHLAVASIATRSLTHVEALYALLSPYPHFHAADLSLHCDGSVSHFLGTLARALGRIRDAVRHLDEAVDRNDAAGFEARAAHSVYELAGAVLESSSSRNTKRARALLARVLDTGRRTGMEPLTRSAEQLLRMA
jgi:hypothetical protein